MTAEREDENPFWVIPGKVLRGITVRASVWDNSPPETVTTQDGAPYGIPGRHIPKKEAGCGDHGIRIIPINAERRGNRSDGAIPDADSVRIRII